MAHKRVTSKSVASKASKVLQKPKSSQAATSAAASALSQRPGKSHRPKQKN